MLTYSSKLLTILSLSRHGSRAPNPVVQTLCPGNAKNLDSYHVPFEQLTEIGMVQMQQLGIFMRQRYIEGMSFLSPSLSDSHLVQGERPEHFEVYFQADPAARCAQSAMTMASGLYPYGTGPSSFPMQPISIVQQVAAQDVTFCVPKTKCFATCKADVDTYDKGYGTTLLDSHATLMADVGRLCGVFPAEYATIPHGEDEVLGIKDVADAFIFDEAQGLPPLPGLNDSTRSIFRQLQFTMLMERYYSTPRQITYWSSDFPNVLLRNFKIATAENLNAIPAIRYYSYHGHRELLYAVSLLLGIPLHFPNQPSAFNQTAVPPAATLLFELHSNDVDSTAVLKSSNTTYYVKTFTWSYDTGLQSVQLKNCSSVECPLDDFANIIHSHFAKTGTWQDICSSSANTPIVPLIINHQLSLQQIVWKCVWTCGVLSIVIIAAAVYVHVIRSRDQYRRIV